MQTSTALGARRLLPTLALAALILSACGGDDAGDTTGDVASVDDLSDEATSDTDGDDQSGDATDDESGDGDDAGPTATTEPVDTETALLEFAACMREHGVDMPDPVLDENGGVQIEIGAGAAPGDGPPPDMDEAMEACEELMPRMGPRDRGDFDPTEMQDEMLEFTKCMREHGVDIDDPTFDEDGRIESRVEVDASDGEAPTGPVLAGPFGTLDLSDPETEAAFEECSEGTMFGVPGEARRVSPRPRSDDE